MRRGGLLSTAALVSLALLETSCLGTPTPLAPGLGGSVGWPHHGVQTGAVELPEMGLGFVRYRKVGGYNWGQPGLVRAVQSAAERVQQALPGGGQLVVGDLSARGGGRVTRHASHRSGRDVDLLWYMTTPDGAPIENTHFVALGPDGLGRDPDVEGGYVRLDVPREWLLIKSLLSARPAQTPAQPEGDLDAERIDVQWMFASRGVEALLIDYAIASAEDPELIWRAENVLQEPVEALPHDDHLHLRIACSPEASVQGCASGDPYWSWLPALPALPDPALFDPALFDPALFDPALSDGDDMETTL